jgi:HEAT repeat protein
LEALAAAAGDDPTVRAVLRQAVHDRDYIVRNNVIVALVKQTGDLSAAVQHWLMMLDEPGNADVAEAESERQQIVQIGVARHIHDLGKRKPKEIITILIPLLKDESPVVRGAAARNLGAIASGSDEAKRLAVKLRVREALQPLLDDRVESVRANAAVGLKRLPK